jgi:uncharacterized membrane protein YgdD (TMEM256/DUF423 family)
MNRLFVGLGALNGFVGVALGAFGAHALRGRLAPGMTEVWQTAIQYHLTHALGLLLVGLVFLGLPSSAALRWSGWLMALGILLFSGSLYLLALTGARWLGAITPFGGTAFLAAWALLALAAWGGR